MSTIKPTHQHGRRTQYRLKGGAWDGPDLDTLLRDVPAPRIGAPHDALVDGDVRLTALDVDDLAGALAGGLQSLGVKRRDVVAWQLPTGYEAVLLFRACWRLGAIAAPLPARAEGAALDAALATLSPTAVVGAKHLALGRHPGAVVVGGPNLPARRAAPPDPARADDGHVVAPGDGTAARATRSGAPFAKLLAAAPAPRSAAQDSDVAVVLFTSGSTGTPKAVIHTHRTLAAKARSLPERDGLGSTDVVLVPNPLDTVTGLLHGLLVPTLAGMTTVLVPDWNPTIVLDLIERERVSYLAGAPSAFRALLRDPAFSARRVRRVRLLSLSGDPVAPSLAAHLARRFGASVKRSYGSTEAPTVTASSPADDPQDGITTDGRAKDDTEVRVVDPQATRDRPAGEEGEIWVRGPEVFAGYLDAERTAASFARGGWFRTGDLGVLDAAGRLTVTGRIDDGVVVDGRARGVAPLEARLQQHPAVDDAAVVLDPTAPGQVIAFVTLDSTVLPGLVAGPAGGRADDRREAASAALADARAWLAETDGSALTLGDVRIVKALPHLGSGQVDRAALRSLATGAGRAPS